MLRQPRLLVTCRQVELSWVRMLLWWQCRIRSLAGTDRMQECRGTITQADLQKSKAEAAV